MLSLAEAVLSQRACSCACHETLTDGERVSGIAHFTSATTRYGALATFPPTSSTATRSGGRPSGGLTLRTGASPFASASACTGGSSGASCTSSSTPRSETRRRPTTASLSVCHTACRTTWRSVTRRPIWPRTTRGRLAHSSASGSSDGRCSTSTGTSGPPGTSAPMASSAATRSCPCRRAFARRPRRPSAPRGAVLRTRTQARGGGDGLVHRGERRQHRLAHPACGRRGPCQAPARLSRPREGRNDAAAHDRAERGVHVRQREKVQTVLRPRRLGRLPVTLPIPVTPSSRRVRPRRTVRR